MNTDPQQEAINFLNISTEFKLGNLITESYHPQSKNLSSMANNNILEALNVLKKIDHDALDSLLKYKENIFKFYQDVQMQLSSGNKIFLCGCGATGRLSIALETIYRKQFHSDQVIGFMAGGDFAYIKSVESFEDRMSYGVRQLLELGYKKDDLVIGITEGGETSFVIGATIEASRTSNVKPYFLYCNPDDVLNSIQRSKDVLDDKNINKLNLTIGPMALSGSTRMQATTVQMFVTGLALLSEKNLTQKQFEEVFVKNIEELKQHSYEFLENFITLESEHYKNRGIVTYLTSDNIAVSLLTDTTERSPTFSLDSFEKISEKHFALCYLSLMQTKNSAEAWEKMLGRKPRGLNWDLENIKIDNEEIFKFDISENAILRRNQQQHNQVFELKLTNQFSFKLMNHEFKTKALSTELLNHLQLKLWLNAHSTLVMGRLNRYQDNIMTYVRTSNFKLIDRASRYAQALLLNRGNSVSYEDIVHTLFRLKLTIKSEESIVLAIVHHFLNA